MKKFVTRLHDKFQPSVYDITLHLDMDAFVFAGEEVVGLVLRKKTKEIIFHSKDLQVTGAKVVDEHDLEYIAKKITYNTKEDWVILQFADFLSGSVKVKLEFRGQIAESMRGVYRSTFEHKGKKKYWATTQFEATEARRCFPCIDEPTAKAVFHVTISAPREHTVISNALPVHETTFDDRRLVKFAPSPKMSTYLLAFVSGEMEFIEKLETKKKKKTLIRVFTAPGKKSQAKFALDTTVQVLEFFEEYFDIDYPLDTLDLIAVPDFESGAMENWGAITFRESSLLIDEKESSAESKQWVATVIAHELAHQWFGNLVTMEWWTHLWLNEGFASYIGTLAVSRVFPKWKTWEGFMTQDFVRGLNKDAAESSHPIEIAVHHPSEIDQIFDDVSYHKGASVIRMLSGYLGDEVFRKGLSHYLKKHKYSNAVTEDLWDAFEYVSLKPVRKIMSTWTSQKGFPLVTVEESRKGLVISQEKFRFQKKGNEASWQIPLNLTYEKKGKQTVKTVLLNKKRLVVEGEGFLKANAESMSFLRVNYTKDQWLRLKRQVERGKLSMLDRFGLLSDIFTLSRAGKVDLDFAWEFLSAYKNETELDIILEIISWVWAVKKLTAGTKKEEKFKIEAIELLYSMFNHFGLTPKKTDTIEDAQSRGFLLQMLAQLGDAKVVEWAEKQFSSGKVEKISPDLRYAVFTGVVATGKAEYQEKLFALYERLEMSEEKERVGQALCLYQSDTLLAKSLKFLLSPKVKDQEMVYLVKFGAKSTSRHAAFWKFIKSHWQDLEKRFGGSSYVSSRLIEMLGSGFDGAIIQDMKAFFRKNKQSVSMGLASAVENIQINSAWKKRELKRL